MRMLMHLALGYFGLQSILFHDLDPKSMQKNGPKTSAESQKGHYLIHFEWLFQKSGGLLTWIDPKIVGLLS